MVVSGRLRAAGTSATKWHRIEDQLFSCQMSKPSRSWSTSWPFSCSCFTFTCTGVLLMDSGQTLPKNFIWRTSEDSVLIEEKPDPGRTMVFDTPVATEMLTSGNQPWPCKWKIHKTHENHRWCSQLDDGWPESAEEQVTLVFLKRECKEHMKDML